MMSRLSRMTFNTPCQFRYVRTSYCGDLDLSLSRDHSSSSLFLVQMAFSNPPAATSVDCQWACLSSLSRFSQVLVLCLWTTGSAILSFPVTISLTSSCPLFAAYIPSCRIGPLPFIRPVLLVSNGHLAHHRRRSLLCYSHRTI